GENKNAFETYGEDGFKPSLDVEAMLNQMMFMGGGETSIHNTQIRCAASMLSSGNEVEHVVAELLKFTRKAAGEYGTRWNWRREENKIRKHCETWLKKYPDVKKKIARERPDMM